MNSLFKAWFEAEEASAEADRREREAYEAAMGAPLPARLRPATAADIVEDAIIWYPLREGRDYHCWSRVHQVMCPDDDFKAYLSHDGARYGLDGAFVEVEEAVD